MPRFAKHVRLADKDGPSSPISSRPDQRADKLDSAVAAQGANPRRCRQLALAQWQCGRREEAYMTLTSALRKYPHEAELCAQLGLFYAAEEQYEQARTHLEEAAVHDGANADVRFWLALVDAALGDTLAAARSFQRALELRPSDLMLAYHLSVAAKAARQDGHSVAMRPPEDRQGQSRAGRGDRLASLVAGEPELVEAFLDTPQTAEELQMILASVESALKDWPNYADLHYECGRLLDRLGRPNEAREHLAKAIQLNRGYRRATESLEELSLRAA